MKKYILLLLVVLAFGGCRNQSATNKEILFVTIEPLRYFAKQIGGDCFEVRTMVPNGSNPETYEPTPRQMVDLSQAKGYIMVGDIGFERTWMKKIKANIPDMKVIKASDDAYQIKPVQSSPGTDDPHTWMSCANAEILVKNMTRFLISLQPQDSALLRQNEKILLGKIKTLNRDIKRRLESRPSAFCIYHPILTYFARDYGLRQFPIEEEGREPGARQLQILIDNLKRNNVGIIFIQKEFDEHNAHTIAKAVNARLVNINPLAYNWPKEMMNIAEALQ